MLLRSSSSSMLNSWLPHSNNSSSSEPEILHNITRTRSITLSASSSSMSPIEASSNRLARVLSETDLSSPKHWVSSPSRTTSFDPTLFSFYEMDEFDGVGGIGEGGGGSNDDGGGSGFSDSNNGNGNLDEFYRAMIEANPGNPIYLGNYARYLKELREDYVKAEEYCGRAILADPSDGKLLSMYADLIWENHKDAPRAECYFDQAVKAAPDNCYALASYAHFLWDAVEEDDVVEEDPSEKSPCFFHGAPPPSATPLAATA